MTGDELPELPVRVRRVSPGEVPPPSGGQAREVLARIHRRRARLAWGAGASALLLAAGTGVGVGLAAAGAPARVGLVTPASPRPSPSPSLPVHTPSPVPDASPTASPATSPSTAAAPPVPACADGQVAVSRGTVWAGLGHIGLVLLFHNTGSASCSLFGYPGVAGLNAAGQQVAQAKRTLSGYLGGLPQGATGPVTVTLLPGQIASALVEGTDVPTGTATSCPTYPALLVTPPNTHDTVLQKGGLPGCSGLQVHPVVPGTLGSTPPQP